jgi:hypothetical protein
MDHLTGVNILDMTKTVDIEYIGDPPILDEVTKFRIANGELPPHSAAIVRGAEAQLSVAKHGITKRVVEPEWFGTSQEYIFGPFTFVVAVLAEDVDKILGSSSGYQFRRVGDPANEILRPAPNMLAVGEIDPRLLTGEEQEGRSLRDIF